MTSSSITFIDFFDLKEDDPKRINIDKLTDMIDNRNDITEIKKLIEDENIDLRVTGWMVKNPIDSAISSKNLEVMKIIFDANGDLIHMKSPAGLKPVHLAAKYGIPCIETLIPYGVDLESKDSRCGMTPLAVACRCGNYEVVEYLIETAGVEIDANSRLIIEEEIQCEFKNRVIELFRRNTY